MFLYPRFCLHLQSNTISSRHANITGSFPLYEVSTSPCILCGNRLHSPPSPLPSPDPNRILLSPGDLFWLTEKNPENEEWLCGFGEV